MSSDPLFDNPDRTDAPENAVPEADLLEQSRPEVSPTFDPEAPADSDTGPRIDPDVEANEADVLEQSIEVPVDDELRGE